MGTNLILLAERRQKSRDLFFSWGFCVPESYSWMRVVAVPFTWLLSNLCSRYAIRSGTFVVNGSEWKRKSSVKAIHPQSGLIDTEDVFSTTCKTFSVLIWQSLMHIVCFDTVISALCCFSLKKSSSLRFWCLWARCNAAQRVLQWARVSRLHKLAPHIQNLELWSSLLIRALLPIPLWALSGGLADTGQPAWGLNRVSCWK